MSISELIGFLISFGAFIFIMFKRVMDDMQKKSSTPNEEASQKEKMKRFLKDLDLDMDEEEDKAPLPPPLPKIKARQEVQKPSVPYAPPMNKFYEDMIEKTPYQTAGKSRPSRARNLIRSLKSKKEMVILNEVIQRPPAPWSR